MMVSSMSETIPSRVSGEMTKILALTGSVPSARSTAVCQPGARDTFTTVSTRPPRSACTRAVTPPISISTSVNWIGTLVNARQPRTFWLPFLAALFRRAAGLRLAGEHHPPQDAHPARGAVALVGDGLRSEVPAPGRLQPQPVDGVRNPVGEPEDLGPGDRRCWGECCGANSMPPLSHSRQLFERTASRRNRPVQAPQQPPQREGIAHGVAAAVVVEIHKDVLSGRLPFPDPVRPPPQVVVRIRTAVEVLVVRSVQPDVNERCRGAEDAGEPGAAHDAIRGPVAFQQGIHLGVVPAGVAELDADPDPVRQRGEEIVQPGVVAREIRRQLDQQHRPLVAELVPAADDPLHPDLGGVELLAVGQAARGLDRQEETLRQAGGASSRRRRPAASGRSWR